MPVANRFEAQLSEAAAIVHALPEPIAFQRHVQWWAGLWNRSHVAILGNSSNPASPVPHLLSRNVVLQRFMDTCTARGAYPIKFNGLIFNYELDGHTADFRNWGGGYWFQNTRFTYWRMLATGDYDLMLPFFDMYKAILPVARYRCQRYFGHAGGWFPESMLFWGLYLPTAYGQYEAGCPHEGPPHFVRNSYMRYYKTQGLELTSMMLAYFQHTEDASFLQEYIIPTAQMVLDFFRYHFQRVNEGQGAMSIFPSASLETWQQVIDSAPDVYGLRMVVRQLQRLPAKSLPASLLDTMAYIAEKVPAIPVARAGNNTYLTPAAAWFPKNSNDENVELYSVFPFRLFGVNTTAPAGLDNAVANYSYVHRFSKCNYGWCQDVIDAAILGRLQDTVSQLVERMLRPSAGIFPVFYFAGNTQYVPDEEHGEVGSIALNAMLMQIDGDRILLMPTWPAEWDVDFKLTAPHQTTVWCQYIDGAVRRLTVEPESRLKDVHFLGPGPNPLLPPEPVGNPAANSTSAAHVDQSSSSLP